MTTIPSVDAPAPDPLTSMNGVPVLKLYPGCVVPSIQTASVMAGKALAIGILVDGDAPAGIENAMRSGPAIEFAAVIAPRRLQCVASQVVSATASVLTFTVKVDPGTRTRSS